MAQKPRTIRSVMCSLILHKCQRWDHQSEQYRFFFLIPKVRFIYFDWLFSTHTHTYYQATSTQSNININEYQSLSGGRRQRKLSSHSDVYFIVETDLSQIHAMPWSDAWARMMILSSSHQLPFAKWMSSHATKETITKALALFSVFSVFISKLEINYWAILCC